MRRYIINKCSWDWNDICVHLDHTRALRCTTKLQIRTRCSKNNDQDVIVKVSIWLQLYGDSKGRSHIRRWRIASNNNCGLCNEHRHVIQYHEWDSHSLLLIGRYHAEGVSPWWWRTALFKWECFATLPDHKDEDDAWSYVIRDIATTLLLATNSKTPVRLILATFAKKFPT